jgi:S-DNA-T family DNA segregation ATPase FtsK/SpoIIIE
MSAPQPEPLIQWRPLNSGTAAPDTPPTPEPGAGSPSSASPGSGPPIFQRAPREYVMWPDTTIEIQPPPMAPVEPSISLISTLLPAMGGLSLPIFAMLIPNSSPIYMLASLPMTLIFIGLAIYNYVNEPRKYRAQMAHRQQVYQEYLAERRQQIEAVRTQQQRASLIPNPDIQACMARAQQRQRRLWERSATDADFLDLRLGTGTMAARFGVKLPAQAQISLQPDELVQAAEALTREFQAVPDAAITLPLAQAGAAGLAGPRQRLQDVTRALIIHLATHHAPSDVRLICTFPQHEADAWAWMRWLPHTWSDDRSMRFLAATPQSAESLLYQLEEVLKQRQIQSQSIDNQVAPYVPVIVCVFADTTMLQGTAATRFAPLLHLLLHKGPSLGAYTLFLAHKPEDVYKECQAIIDLTDSRGSLRLIGPPPVEIAFQPDTADPPTAEGFARSLAPLRLQAVAGTNELPAVLPLLELLGAHRVEDIPILEHWQHSKPFQSLATPIGVRSSGQTIYLDCHEQKSGPHGLIAGETGSGKSELLQSLVASLALHFHPHEVAFVLIDYKGGGMANVFRDLPHQIGIITNLEGNMATRALAALRTELQNRQLLFDTAGVNHIDEYMRYARKQADIKPLPHLFIIADEFAELVQSQPEFIQEVISVVRIGRSLGVHLLLATQKPAGVVNDQIWGNTRFRLCLRVANTESSHDVLKRPDAAFLRQAGRAYLQVGLNELFELFQTAWSGAPYDPTNGTTNVTPHLVEVGLDGKRKPLTPGAHPTTAAPHADVPQRLTQLQAIVSYIHELCHQNNIAPLPAFWLPPLPQTLVLNDARKAHNGGWDGQYWRPGTAWLSPRVGIVDDPARHFQGALSLDIGKEGHLVIVGAPGTGKTTLLQTLITSLLLDHSPLHVNLYLIDFGGHSFKIFEGAPHVGAVLTPDDDERIQRLFYMLLREMEERQQLLARAGASTFLSYRAQTTNPVPEIVVVLDNYTGFGNTYPDASTTLERLARESSNLGIHLVVTANMANALPLRLSNNIAMALALELNDPGEYSTVVGRTNGLIPARGVRGRGLIRGTPPLEFQAALPAAGHNDVIRTQALKRLTQTMARCWRGPTAQPIATLPAHVPLSSLIPTSTDWEQLADTPLTVPIGLHTETLEPVRIALSDGPYFLITGPPAVGKTVLLQSWLLALSTCFPPSRLRFYLSGLGSAHLFPLRNLPHTAAYVEDENDLHEMLDDVRGEVEHRSALITQMRHDAGGVLDQHAILRDYPALVIAIDDFDEFLTQAGYSNLETLEKLTRRARSVGLHILLTCLSNDPTTFYTSFGKLLKDGQTGFLLGTNDQADQQVLNLRLPITEMGKSFPPGRGYFARRGQYQPLQSATCHIGTLTLIRNRHTGP